VVWQTAAVIYNLLNNTDDIRAVMVKRGVVQVIFDLAVCGYTSVTHLCSAALHTVTDHIPNVENPIVLELITSLLDAESDELSQLTMKTTEDVGYDSLPDPLKSGFVHDDTGFKANWLVMSCDLESFFKPTIMKADTTRSKQMTPANLTTAVKFDPPSKIDEHLFNSFDGSTRPNPPKVPALLHISSIVSSHNSSRVPTAHSHPTVDDDGKKRGTRFIEDTNKGTDYQETNGATKFGADVVDHGADDEHPSDDSMQEGRAHLLRHDLHSQESEEFVDSDSTDQKNRTKHAAKHGSSKKSKKTSDRRSSKTVSGAKRSSVKTGSLSDNTNGHTLPSVTTPDIYARPPPSAESNDNQYHASDEDSAALKSMHSRADLELIGRSSSTGHLGGKLAANNGHILINPKTSNKKSGKVGVSSPTKSPSKTAATEYHYVII
jgi:hypothetical protein